MESYKTRKVMPLTIEVSVIDPNRFYSSEFEDSDYSDSGSETSAEETNMCKTTAAPSSNPEKTQLKSLRANDTANETAPAGSESSSEEDDTLEPVELIDGLFDFVTFNTETDMALEELEKVDKQFDLESYITDGSGSSTSSSRESRTSSEESTSPISSPQGLEWNNSNGDTVSAIRYGKGRGKDYATLVKCYQQKTTVTYKSLSQTSSEAAEVKSEKQYKMKLLVKSVKETEVKPTEEKFVNTTNGKEQNLNLKTVKEKCVKPTKEEVKAKKVDKVKPTKVNEVKTDNENKPTKESEVKLGKENKQIDNNKNCKETRKHSSVQVTHSATHILPYCSPEEVDSNLDDFTKAILASMTVVQRKPDLEKRRNSGMRNRVSHFKECPPNFQQYLKETVRQPKTAQVSSNHITTVKDNTLSKNASVNNMDLKTPPQEQPKITAEICAPIRNNAADKRKISIQEYLSRKVELKTQQQQKIKTENCAPIEGMNTGESKTYPQQQHSETQTCATTENKEVPDDKRRISIQEFLSRKRSHQSSNNDSDSNIVTKKRRELA